MTSFLLFLSCCVAVIVGSSGAPSSALLALPAKLQAVSNIRNPLLPDLERPHTGHACKSNSDCESPRTCITSTGDSLNECPSNATSCICIGVNNLICADSKACLSNDRCIKEESTGTKVCLSCTLVSAIDATTVDDGMGKCNSTTELDTESNSTDSCIAVQSLRQFAPSELVYEHDRQALVLCDEQYNCATPSHMVIYHDRPMTMTSYCNQTNVLCRHRVMFVNSPRMKIGLRIPSNSKPLLFTTMAAKYGTKLEEALLSGLVRLGV